MAKHKSVKVKLTGVYKLGDRLLNKAVTKMQTILLVVVITIAAVAGTYLVTTQLAPPSETVARLTLITEQTSGSLKEAIEAIIDLFNDRNPDIVVTHQPMDHVSFNTVLSIWLSSDAAPDLHQWWGGARTQEIVDLGYVLDFTDAFAKYEDQYSEGIQQGHLLYDGEVKAITLGVFTYGLWYMTDILEEYDVEPPETWDELVAACETIWTESGGTVYPFQVPSKFPWLPDLQFTTILSQSVSPEFFNGLITGTQSWQDPQVLSAFQRYAELVPYLPPYHTELGEFEATQEMSEGRVAMEISGPWRGSMLKDAGKTPEADFDFVPVPQILSQYSSTMPTHSDVIVANIHTQYPEQCRRFLEFVASPEAQQLYVEISGNPSGNNNVDPSVYDVIQTKIKDYMDGQTASVVEVSLAVREEITVPWFDLMAEFLQTPENYEDIARRLDDIAWAPD